MRTDLRHTLRLARVDLKLLGRNHAALFNVVLLPLVFGVMITQLGHADQVFVLTGVPGILLAFVVFANLVNAFVVRREERVLKRLRGWQPSAAAIFGGAGLAAFVIYAVQLALFGVGIHRAGGGLPANVPLIVVASLLGVAVFTALAAAFSGPHRNAELAQITVTPVILVLTFATPIVYPLEALPEPLRLLAALLPATPVVEIVRTAYTGRDYIGVSGGELSMVDQWVAALPSFGVLLAWLVVGGLLARWLFRWDPRHG
ncbi:ABC transporter permease [Thermasporomyces composti]|jgi:ABC-2 type transport system permease protein|uniref:ABC-2 type transport system permease protein n=1 Tax=Thermasporomyces composti TaxID=696763 RepID=A0A3D9V9J5_THECX|nr:ABC transporter permease [Thermasporomyces composti]REF36830.1 ABC-2 type transport system permease protein [Thermasporomyces composti]